LDLKAAPHRIQSVTVYSYKAAVEPLIMQKSEINRLQQYLQEKFGNRNIRLSPRKEAGDSAEVLMGDEFIGVIYRDEDEGEISYDFNMAILEMDLPPAA